MVGVKGHPMITKALFCCTLLCSLGLTLPVFAAPVATLPVRSEMWGLADADRLQTATRERISLNGLWAFKVDPAASDLAQAPTAASVTTFFKVPGMWPSEGAKNGMAVYDSQGNDVYGTAIKKIDSAWYVRTVEVPSAWNGRAVKLGFAWIPSVVLVYVDGRKAGEVFFPGGEIDLTTQLTAGSHEIALFTTAKLAEQMVTAFDAPDTARSFAKKSIRFRGLNGDVYLAAEPKGITITDVQCRPSVKEGRLDLSLGFACSGDAPTVIAVADVYEGARKVKSFASDPFTPCAAARFVFGGPWKDAKLWDLDAPENLYSVKVRLEQAGRVVDELYAETFGFREIRIEGRNLTLNGSILHLRPRNTSYPIQSAVSIDDMRQTFLKMKDFGFNSLVSESNYGFSEGDVSMFEQSVRAASSVGMAMVIGLPHPNRFDDPKNPHHWQYGPAYDRLVKHMVRRFQNVPGVLYWSSTHNATGYESDQNPELISGRPDEVPTGIVNWRQRFRKMALTVNEKMAEFDPTRPVYHHESGAEGTFYTLNCYLDWAPIQERSDWFEHWEQTGVMPLIIVEWGTPHIASWSSYRGGPKGVNIWSARDWTQQCWMNEYNAAFLGEKAYADSPAKQLLMQRHQYKLKGNKPAYFGGNFTAPLIDEPDTQEVASLYARRNYRDLRARGVTSFLPWDMDGGFFFTNNPAIPKARTVRTEPFAGIKAFGVVKSDYSFGLFDQVDELPRGPAWDVKRCYTPMLAWIAGPVGDFTTVNRTYRTGETVKKSLVILNDTRRPQTVEWAWKAGSEKGKGAVSIKPGCRADIPVSFTASASAGRISAAFRTADWKASDRFDLEVLPGRRTVKLASKVYLFDPEGTARPLLDAIGIKSVAVSAAPKDGLLVIGRHALPRLPFALGDVARAGVKVVVLEQDTATMTRLGFRMQEHGLRNLFASTDDFKGVPLADWRGRATSLPESLKEDKNSAAFPRWNWDGHNNTRVWRAGNRGIVSAVLPEKPTKGDFMPYLHGGFNLQYAPVMEYAEPGVRIVFSQLDLCGRTERSPEAEEAFAKILEMADCPLLASTSRTLVYEGWGKVQGEFKNLGLACSPIKNLDEAKAGDLLVIGPGAKMTSIRNLVEKGVKVLCLGITGKDANLLVPGCQAQDAGWTAYPDVNAQLASEPLFKGISNADLQWTYPSNIGTLARFGKDVLHAEHMGKGVVVFCALTPWTFDAKEIALRSNRRRAQGLLTRLVCNLGGRSEASPLVSKPSLYGDKSQADDDPYRYYRW